jgi:hypothetical protein
MAKKKKRKPKKSMVAHSRKSAPKVADETPTDPKLETSGLTFWLADRASYIFLVICVLAQLATIFITWPTWQVREFPVNLPWIAGAPQMPMGVLLALSLLLVLVAPRKKFGMPLHLIVLFVAIAMDQFRCQPQVLSITVLMMACVWKPIRQLCIWYLISMWLWTGIHKLISPDWFGHSSVNLLKRLQLINPYHYNVHFAVIVAASEIGLGVLAFLRPRIAAFFCVALHAGITIFLCKVNWNQSVWPWNLCTAIVGAWLLYNASVTPPKIIQKPNSKWQLAVLFAILVVPAGFYFGIVRNCFAHVLYSDHLPVAAITRGPGKVELLNGWNDFAFPFPRDKAAFVAYLKASGKPGEKLHVLEPRKLVKGGYFELDANGQVKEIDEPTFFASKANTTPGIGCDDPRAVLKLELADVSMRKRELRSMIFAAVFEPEKFTPDLLECLRGLPNVEEIQLEGCQIRDEDVRKLVVLPKLKRVGLSDTPITPEGLRHLKKVKSLEAFHYRGEIYLSVDEALTAQNQ